VLVGPAYSGITDVAAEAQKRDEALARQPDDPEARLDVAESSLLQALEVEVARVRGGVRLAQAQRTLLLEDAKRHLDAAVAAGADGWRPKALEAVMRSQRGQQQRAFQLAAEAMPNLPPDAPGRLAKELLTLFAHGRQAAIQDAVRNKKEWPGAWTTDVHTAYTLLMKHPLGTPQNVADHYDFLEFFRSPDAEVVLQKGVERFPAAAPLHHRLRGLWLRQGGVARMEKEYAKLLAKDDAPAVLPWFAGYASLVAAEQHRRRSHPDDARASYNQALRHFASYRERTQSEDGAHYEAMAHGGLARLALQAGDLDLTFSELQQVFRIAPLAAAAVDGLSISAMQTAEALRGKALQDDPELVERLDAALLQLPDDAFLLPEYEQRNPGNPRYSRLRPRK
jgi:tetratricopeptide (TPR) repeat protein